MAAAQLQVGDVGAWVLKCNPRKTWDYFANSARGQVPFRTAFDSSWTLGNTYRNELVAASSPTPVLLWVVGVDAAIHEVGLSTGGTFVDVIDERDLIDEELRGQPVTFAKFVSVRLARPVSRRRFVEDPLLSNSEPIRVPQLTNPSFLTPDEPRTAVKYFHPDDLRAAGWDRLGLVTAKP